MGQQQQGYGNQGMRGFGNQGGFGNQQFGNSPNGGFGGPQGFGGQQQGFGAPGGVQMQSFGSTTMGIGGMPNQMGGMMQQGGMMGSPQMAGGMPSQPMVSLTSPPPPDKVSIWRALFIANELNERIGSTRTSVFITWLLMATFLEGLSIKNAARWQPNLSTEDTSPLYNPLVMFGISTGIWIAIIVGQLLIRRIASIFQGGMTDFIDICSLSNVSVLILDEPCHGYYIHGQAPGGTGDCSGTLMNQRLKQEKEGLLLKRGIRPDDDLQTFEMFFPPAFRANLFTLYSSRPQGIGAEERIEENSVLRMRVQQFLLETMDGCRRTDKMSILPMTFFQRMFGVTCSIDEIVAPQTGRLYEDQSMFLWLSPLLYGGTFCGIPSGSEWRLLISEVLLFNSIWRFTESVYAGVAAAFLFHQLIQFIRQAVGSSALERTSFVDGRFLL